MSANPINAWDELVFVANEGVQPTNFAVGLNITAAQALQVITADLGTASQSGKVRPMKDRSPGRGMQSAWVEGDFDPVELAFEYSQKSRAAIDSPCLDLAIMKAAGLKQIINGSTSTTLSLVPTPIENGEFQSLQTYRTLGEGVAAAESELANGGVITNIVWSGGDKEVNVKATGKAAKKLHSGQLDSFTFASAVDTSFTLTLAQARLLSPGMAYQIENEVVVLTSLNRTTFAAVFARAQYSSSGAAHAAKQLRPYIPPSIAFTGAPLSEVNCSAILGTISPIRIMSWEVALKTGVDLLPHETSSGYIQGAKSVRHDVSAKMKMVLSQDRLDLAGYAVARDTLQLSLAQGTGVGGIMTFTLPYCEVVTFKVSDTIADIAIVDVELRVRNNGNVGDNAMSITLT